MALRKRMLLAALALVTMASAQVARASELRIAIMQAQAGDARKYQPLVEYLSRKGFSPSFVTAPDYRAAAELFGSGKVDAMFSGSGIAGTMMIKGVAEPLVRPVGNDGISTYSAVVIAPARAPRFDGSPGYFDGKRVIFCSLASAGEFYFHSLGRSRPAALLKAASHGAAIDALSRGAADVAIVKNRVWAKEQGKYGSLVLVGGDAGENPDNTLIVSKRFDAAAGARLSAVLLGLGADASPAAAAVRSSLGIRGFVPTTSSEFSHTLALLGRAGITKEFAFVF